MIRLAVIVGQIDKGASIYVINKIYLQLKYHDAISICFWTGHGYFPAFLFRQ